jgi:hypothetical protein
LYKGLSEKQGDPGQSFRGFNELRKKGREPARGENALNHCSDEEGILRRSVVSCVHFFPKEKEGEKLFGKSSSTLGKTFFEKKVSLKPFQKTFRACRE